MITYQSKPFPPIDPGRKLRIVSFGGGVQSMAILVLIALGILHYDMVVFCNVGDDSESPETLTYIQEVVIPFVEKHGICFVILQKTFKNGQLDTIYSKLTRPGSRSIGIPVRMSGNGAPGRRSCTYDYKILQVDKLANKLRVGQEVEVAIGFSVDEIERVKPNTDPDTPWKTNVFPSLRRGRSSSVPAGLYQSSDQTRGTGPSEECLLVLPLYPALALAMEAASPARNLLESGSFRALDQRAARGPRKRSSLLL